MDLYEVWAVRYLPEPIRGEFINVGVLAGRDDSEGGGDWVLKTVSSFKRAQCLGGTPSHIAPYLEDLAARVDPPQAPASLLTADSEGARWSRNEIERLRVHSYGTVQFSRPMPAMAESAAEAADMVFDALVLAPEVEKTHRPRTIVRNRLQTALQADARIGGRFTSVRNVKAGRALARMDFSVGSTQSRFLARAWAFDIENTSSLEKDLGQWSWATSRIREGGGEARPASSTGARSLSVPRTVPIAALYSAPTTANGRDALAFAQEAWAELEVSAYVVGEEGRLLDAAVAAAA